MAMLLAWEMRFTEVWTKIRIIYLHRSDYTLKQEKCLIGSTKRTVRKREKLKILEKQNLFLEEFEKQRKQENPTRRF